MAVIKTDAAARAESKTNLIHSARILLSRRLPALDSRDFAIFWVGHLFSLIGTSMQNTAQPLLAYRISGRPFDLGVIGFAFTLPTFFLAMPSGVLVERWDKRKAVMILQAVMMIETFILALLTLTGAIQIWHIVLLSLVLGIATTFEITARQSMLIELAGRETLPNAIALQSTAFNLSRVLGPALTAPLLLLLPSSNGEGWIFLLNGISFGAIIFSLFFVKPKFRADQFRTDQSFFRDFLDGGRYIRSNRQVGLIIVIVGILGMFGFPIMQQIPVLAKDILAHAGDTKSIVDARNSVIYASMGVGALIAALMIAFNSQTGKGLRLLAGEAAFIGGLTGIGLVVNLWQAALLISLVGWGSVTQLATMNTLIQTQIPDDLRGRVVSIYIWGLQGVAPIGSLLIGWMTQIWNLPFTALLCGSICLAGIGFIQFRYPDVRRSPA